MRVVRSRLESTAKVCLGVSLVSLAAVALLVNVAFYSTLADYWPVARILGPAVFGGAVLMAGSFMLGLMLHALVVASGRRQAIGRREAVPVHSRPHARRIT